MAGHDQADLTKVITRTKVGSIVAAAGCGKTEQIALTIKYIAANEPSKSLRPLILTHTHAGVDVLRQRLRKHSVPGPAYQLDTIASWCLRYATAYPVTSGFPNQEPKDAEWSLVYQAALRLIQSGAVDRVLQSSYGLVLVDEYQDCDPHQHELFVALKERLPVCIFGDPLQSIFDFNDVVAWETQVLPVFPEVGRLTRPWRWENAQKEGHGNWLARVRDDLENGRKLDFSINTDCFEWIWLPDQDGPKGAKISEVCRDRKDLDGRLVIIGNSSSENVRAGIAKKLGNQHFSVIEPIGCITLFTQAIALDKVKDGKRLIAVMTFLSKCMTGIGKKAPFTKTPFMKAVNSKRKGGKAGRTRFGTLIDIGDQMDQADGENLILELVLGFRDRHDTRCFRRELLSAMISALRAVRVGEAASLQEAVASVRARSRHLGRVIPRRCVGSTLLVKGLEFEHAVIVEYPGMTKEDWYVALTRATHSVTVLSSSKWVTPV